MLPKLIQQNHAPSLFLGAVLVAFAWLTTTNLNYVPLLPDEAVMATIARNLLEFGSPIVDDGRNVFSHGTVVPPNYSDLSASLEYRYPPLQFYAVALGFLLFGEHEFGARIMSAFFALASMLLFWSILRREFPNRPWFNAVAVALACFSPMIILYARAAVYNSQALFWTLLLYRLYLSFCSRARIATALAILAAALAGFHTHHLISFSFVCALAIFHLLFRRSCFDRRAWAIAISIGLIYAGQALWYGYLDPDAYAKDIDYDRFGFGFILAKIPVLVGVRLLNLNNNGILFWTVAVAFLGWRIIAKRSKPPPSPPRKAHQTLALSGLAIGPGEMARQYLILILIIITCLTITIAISSSKVVYETRYLTALTPFAAVPGAELLTLIWRRSRLLSLATAAVLVGTNAAGYPLAQHSFYGNNIRLTLPTLIAEFQQEYPSALPTVVAHLRANAKQDDLVYSNNHYDAERMIFYLGDKLLIGGVLARANKLPAALDTSKRAYLFKDDIIAGLTPPDWIVFLGQPPKQEKITLSKSVYDLDLAVVEPFGLLRPEPAAHLSKVPQNYPKSYTSAIYRRVD